MCAVHWWPSLHLNLVFKVASAVRSLIPPSRCHRNLPAAPSMVRAKLRAKTAKKLLQVVWWLNAGPPRIVHTCGLQQVGAAAGGGCEWRHCLLPKGQHGTRYRDGRAAARSTPRVSLTSRTCLRAAGREGACGARRGGAGRRRPAGTQACPAQADPQSQVSRA